MKPICFMIMPYGKKTTQAEAGHGVATVDFNAAGAAASSVDGAGRQSRPQAAPAI
jgi:hypothetical protein